MSDVPPATRILQAIQAGDDAGARFLRTTLGGAIDAGMYEEFTIGALSSRPSDAAIGRVWAVLDDVLDEFEEVAAALQDPGLPPADPVDEVALARAIDEAIGEAHVVQVAEWVSGASLGMRPRAGAAAGSVIVRRCVKPSAVKLGILLLGGDFEGAHDELLMLVGRHEELTRYCVEALRASRPDAEQQILQLARSTRGYGRLAAVRALQGTRSAETRAWLLQEGWWSSPILPEVAIIAAEQGEVLRHLRRGDMALPDLVRMAGLVSYAGSRLTEWRDAMPVVIALFDALADRELTPMQRSSAQSAADAVTAKLRGQLDGEAPQRWSMQTMNAAFAATKTFLAD